METARAHASPGGSRRILAFPFHDWRKGQAEGFRTRDGHLIQAFARRADVERILVVDRPTSAAERWVRQRHATAAGELEVAWSIRGARASITRVWAATDVLDVALWDILAPLRRGRAWWFDVFRRPEVADAIDRAVREQLGRPTDVIAWVPTVAPVLFRSGARVVFDSLDNWLIHPVLRAQRAEAEAAYAAILPRAERVYASGPASARALARWRQNIDVVPNGVDPRAFEGSFPRPPDMPTGPVVGYAGKIAHRIDSELVAEAAAELPNVRFVFIGPILDRRAIHLMRRLDNVVLLGDRAYSEIPAYLSAFDVAWIPHRVGDGETGGDPIKLYEYWAAGRQVISTRIDGSQAWGHQVRLVDDASEAVDAIRGILDGSLPRLPTEVPPGRTWDEIANVLLAD